MFSSASTNHFQIYTRVEAGALAGELREYTRPRAAELRGLAQNSGSQFKYIADMKSRVVVFLVLALAAVLTLAQNQPNREKKPPLFFLKIAADVAGNVQSQSLNGFLAIYVDEKSWNDAVKDSDLGPFLKAQEAQPGRSAGCLFSSRRDTAICVYFGGDVPLGVAAVRTGAGGKIEAGDVAAAYKAVSKEMLKKGKEDLSFTEGKVTTDDGFPLPAFQIASKSLK
jgi:hypothetical protein